MNTSWQPNQKFIAAPCPYCYGALDRRRAFAPPMHALWGGESLEFSELREAASSGHLVFHSLSVDLMQALMPSQA